MFVYPDFILFFSRKVSPGYLLQDKVRYSKKAELSGSYLILGFDSEIVPL